ncbi:hypothetical protein ROHU_027044 [Labeo rohita]|uniref:Uncharacterized protein n=1 Tax=Labeo rohita TaxID=84645 RepID=A0A498MDI7_LABRO|nr:hypothetical protein ROHU_027044 [Labeo rohita]
MNKFKRASLVSQGGTEAYGSRFELETKARQSGQVPSESSPARCLRNSLGSGANLCCHTTFHPDCTIRDPKALYGTISFTGVSPITLLYVADSAVLFDELVNGIETNGMKVIKPCFVKFPSVMNLCFALYPRIVQPDFNNRSASIERLWGPCRATCSA